MVHSLLNKLFHCGNYLGMASDTQIEGQERDVLKRGERESVNRTPNH